MLNWLSNPKLLIAGVLFALLQVLAALPWLRAIDPKGFARGLRSPSSLGMAVLVTLGLGVAIAGYLGYLGDSPTIRRDGKFYAAALHLQLIVDFFILAPHVLLLISPKAGAVALAAYREGWRQPMFWLIAGFALVLMVLAVWFPYFTFGDDFKMMKQVGFDIIMLASVLFGVLAASMSISEEIEGRTAITVMSKPINRRNFLVGKTLGILLACAAMSLMLGWCFNFALWAFPEYDKINQVQDSLADQAEADLTPAFVSIVPGTTGKVFASGVGSWFADTVAHSLGILLGFGQVMILVSIAAALATRLTFVVNVLLCLMVYFFGHLAPVVVRVSDTMSGEGTVGVGLVRFFGQLFDTILPALEFFNMGPAIIRETPLDLWQFATYVLTVFGYSVIYTLIVLIVGLLLFEDRDLA
jgi:ABC-type transport system involved in multi-copper enzyme maturation permease subunit